MNRASRSAPLCKSINEPRTIHLSRPQGTIRLTSIPFGSMQRQRPGSRRHRSGGFAQGIHGIGWFRGRKRVFALALQDCMQLPVRPSAKGFGSCRHVKHREGIQHLVRFSFRRHLRLPGPLSRHRWLDAQRTNRRAALLHGRPSHQGNRDNHEHERRDGQSKPVERKITFKGKVKRLKEEL